MKNIIRTVQLVLITLSPLFSVIISQDTLVIDQQDEIVITGTRFEIPIEKSGKTIYKLSNNDLQKNAGKSVADLINEIPGVHVDGAQGAPGTNPSYTVRGARNKNVLILIDGLPLNDPSGIDAFYDLRLLGINQIESIEVSKGGLSSLYGSNASAGVINISLKQSGKEKFAGNVDVNYGSYNTIGTGVNLHGKTTKVDYLISGSVLKSDGFSEALDESGIADFDDDGIEKQNFLAKINFSLNEKLSIGVLGAYDAFDTEYDGGSFFDAENQQIVSQFRFGVSPEYKYDKGTIKLNTVFNANDREFISSFPTQYQGQNISADLSQNHKFSESVEGVWGIAFQDMKYAEEGISTFEDSHFTTIDPYASFFYDNNNFNLHAGVRLNTHSEYDAGFVYNVNPSYLFDLNDATKFKFSLSHSTAYVAPSLFQTYSAFFGNTGVQPENTASYEAGLSLYLNDNININTSYYQRDETNPIGFVSTFDDQGQFLGGAYQNVTTERSVNGFEADANIQITKELRISAYYAYTTTEDLASFYRIPKNKFGSSIDLSLIDNLNINIKYNFIGQRTTLDFATFSELTLDSYQLIDFYANYKIQDDRLTIYGAVNNILNTDFQGIYGFTSRGRNFTLGINYKF